MSAKDGKPCKKCGLNEWYSNGQCAPCGRLAIRKWQEANPEKVRGYNREARLTNPEKNVAAVRAWEKRNPDKADGYKQKYAKENPDKLAAAIHKSRTKQTGAGGSYTATEFRDLCNQYGNRCLGCGRDDVQLTADHIVPVSKGGTSDISNIQPLCKSCNSSKHDKTIDYRAKSGPTSWLKKKLF